MRVFLLFIAVLIFLNPVFASNDWNIKNNYPLRIIEVVSSDGQNVVLLPGQETGFNFEKGANVDCFFGGKYQCSWDNLNCHSIFGKPCHLIYEFNNRYPCVKHRINT